MDELEPPVTEKGSTGATPPEGVEEDYERIEPSIHRKKLEWERPAAEIRGMSAEQLRQEIVELNERVRRLYTVHMLQIEQYRLDHPGEPLPSQIAGVDNLLNPENIE